MDNIFYSLSMQESLNRKTNYRFEIFSYKGSYMDLISAIRNNDPYDLADDNMYDFIDIDIGELFTIMLNDYDNLDKGIDDIYKERIIYLIELKNKGTTDLSCGSFELASSVYERDRAFLKYVLTKAFTDNKIASQVEYIKSMEFNNIISYEIMTKYKKRYRNHL